MVWRCTIGICHIVLIRRETSQRHTDEVHQVVTSESHSQGESTHQHRKLEDVDTAEVQEFHHNSRHHEGDADEETEILVDVIAYLSRQVRTLAQTLHKDEVREGCKGDTAEDGDAVA